METEVEHENPREFDLDRRDIELPRHVNYSRIEIRPDARKLLLYHDEEGE